jgi:hypothetical protein
VNEVALTYISALVGFLYKIVISVRGYEQDKNSRNLKCFHVSGIAFGFWKF